MALTLALNNGHQAQGVPLGNQSTKSTAKMSRFTLFKSLPPELRDMIWDFALPDDIPELYMRPHQSSSPLKALAPPGPLLVQTAYPVLMHVCRESRELTLSRIHLQTSKADHRAIAHRVFRPDLDIIQLSYSGIAPTLWFPEVWRATLAPQIQQVALEANTLTAYMRYQLAEALQYLTSLQTLHVIFMSTAEPLQIGEELIPRRPTGRCALRPFTPTQEKLKFTVGSPEPKGPEWDLSFLYNHLQDLVRTRVNTWGDKVKIAAWDYEKQSLKLNIVAQVVVRYQANAGVPSWVEIGDV